MKIVVLHNEPSEDASGGDQDVLVQRDEVAKTLRALRHETICLGCTLNLSTVQRTLLQLQPDVVFNLVESLGGTDRLMTLASLLLDALHLPYTGARTEAILATSNKLAAKERLRAGGLPTPAWMRPGDQEIDPTDGTSEPDPWGALPVDGEPAMTRRWIIKPVWEHASFGLNDGAVIADRDPAAIEAKCRDRQQRCGRPHFAERFVEGREFNLSLLAGEVLPAAEIDFSRFPPDKPRIVGHQAKWEQDSFEYQQTPRRFDFSKADAPLLVQLADLARRCWQLFGLRGYARVDFRVDGDGRPWILEINANPCLSADAGFAAALDRGGLDYQQAIQRILEEALDESTRCDALVAH